jgi:hypothetical protein
MAARDWASGPEYIPSLAMLYALRGRSARYARRRHTSIGLVAWVSGARPRTLLTSTKVHASEPLAARESLYREPVPLRTSKTGSARRSVD